MGQEHQRTYRTCRVMAERLATTGVDVLRFDYYGTGESAGEGEELTIRGCIEDTRVAVQEVMDLAGVRRVTLVGVRLGGLVAALAAQGPTVDRLVLCDPVLDGRSYEEEVTAEAAHGPDERGTIHFRGFPVTRAVRTELRALVPEDLPAFPGRVLALMTVEPAENAWLAARVEALGAGSGLEYFHRDPYWTEGDGAGIGVGAVPAELVARVAEWHT